jgi:hypothetical protein|nr:MAG TPA: hypothetical protein [Caudoviricetes sp.]
MQPYVNPNYFNAQPQYGVGNYYSYQPQRMNPAEQNYNSYVPQMQTGPIQQNQGIHGKFIQMPENIVANDVPMDGSVAIFPMQDMSSIFVKSWGADGKIATVVFKPVLNDNPNNLPSDAEKAKFDLSDEATAVFMKRFDELEQKIEQLKTSQTQRKTSTSQRKDDAE